MPVIPATQDVEARELTKANNLTRCCLRFKYFSKRAGVVAQ